MARVSRFATVLLLAVLAVTVPAGAALAHATLRSIDPADGATLAQPPAAIRLTFTEDVLAGTAQVRLTGPAGQIETTPTTRGPLVSAVLPPDLPAGGYTLLWRVTSADGHPISGESTFTVTVGSSPTAAATDSPVPSPTTAGAAAVAPAPSPSPSAAIDPLDPLSAATGTSGRLLVVLGAALATAAAVGGLVARRRRSQP